MFFRNLLKNIRKRQAGMAPPIRGKGGFLRNLMLKNRNRRNMLMPFRSGKFNMPLFGRRQGIMSLMSPASYDRDVNDLPTPQAGASLDIMPQFGTLPKQPPQVGTAPLMTGGNAALLPPDIAPLPPKPMMGGNMGMPNFMSAGQPPKMVMGMKEGGEAKYPNEGLAALAKERPDVVKKILGREEGGIMDIQNFPRRSPEMLIDQLNNIIDTDSKYAESVILPNTIFRNNDYENRRKNDPFFTDIYGRPQAESDRPDGVPFFVTNPFSASILKIIEAIKGVDLRNDPIGIDKVNFLRRRLIDNIKQIEDQGGTVDPDVKAQAMFVERRFKERNMPLTD
jgi:hypothetical protein